ncbi:zinc ribbon domain-containing protein [Pseudanabaena sp. BC1403]|uniref:zinc ribbon domain-containing protein n=1 Tax=Pseudanabaena sp. BC1403 TaxID=2043171 RepID=UPI000CD8738A|nr:zinc ribbon domain-containing protein [Pseudanabaena sp. BC1403]
MTETRTYQIPEIDLNELADNLQDWYKSKNFTVQKLTVDGGGVLVQASQGGWRDVVGISSSLNVVLRQNESTLLVEIGAGKWLDKAAVGAVGVFFLWPLAVTNAWGVWKQSQLPKQTYDFIQKAIDMKVAAQYTPSTQSLLPQLGALNDSTNSFKFCPACGNSVGENDRFCSKCGHTLT